MERIYLDRTATSPMHPEVIERMTEVMKSEYGNPSSIHYFGRSARHIVDEARSALANSIGAKANDIIFTSGGTEADNHAILEQLNPAAIGANTSSQPKLNIMRFCMRVRSLKNRALR